jgi:hypothetical protein
MKLKFLRENIGQKFHDISLGYKFLEMTPKIIGNNSKNSQADYIKLKE